MAEIIQFRSGLRKMNAEEPVHKEPVHKQIDSLDDRTAFLISQSIQDVKRVNDPTRRKIASNLGEILSRYNRSRLHLGDMMAMALDTQNIKAVERLGRFRIKPGKEPSESTLKYLSRKLHDYVSIITATASLTGDSRSKLLVELFKGTRFSAIEETDDDRQSVEEQLSWYLNRYATFIFEKCRVQDYFSESRRYKAVPKYLPREERQSKGRNLTFEVNHDGWNRTSFPEINLFSRIRSVADGYYRHVEIKKIPLECERVECQILSLELIGFGIYPVGANNEPNLVFSTVPVTGVRLKDSKHTNIYKVIPDQSGIWSNFYTDSREDFLAKSTHGRSYEHHIEEKMSKPNSIFPIDYFELDQELDLSWILRDWQHLASARKEIGQRYFGQHSWKLEKNLKRVSASTIREIFDVSRADIVAPGSVFEKKFDTSRAISPPNTMLAELEINLWYEGYNTTFDDSSQKEMDLYPVWDYSIDNDGNIIDHSFIPEPYVDTILENLENVTEELSHAYFEWRNEIVLETKKRSKNALDLTEARLSALRSGQNQ